MGQISDIQYKAYTAKPAFGQKLQYGVFKGLTSSEFFYNSFEITD